MSLEERLRQAASAVEAQVAARIDADELLADLGRRGRVAVLHPVAVGVGADTESVDAVGSSGEGFDGAVSAEVRTAEGDVDRLVHMLGSQRRDALEDVDVLEIAQAAAQTVGWARESEIKVQGSKRTLRIRSNPTMLRQAIENLIDNAATCGMGAPVDVVVRFSVARRLPGIEVLVADRGPGLGRAPASRRSGGGVGLQLVRKFVSEAGGRLWSHNREGGGALFGLWLPAEGRSIPISDLNNTGRPVKDRGSAHDANGAWMWTSSSSNESR